MVLPRSRLIQGPVLLGFGTLFERSYGKPSNKPYPKVIPTSIGGALLPFSCPHCGAVRSAVVDPKKFERYHDEVRGFSWCPHCQGRYVIDPRGTELVGELPKGATHAPALVEHCGKTEIVGLDSPLDLLGTA